MAEPDLVSYLITRIETIDKKVDVLLKFKWQIIGGALAGSGLLTFLMQVVFFVMTKNP
jgi:hypothetical protein